MQSIAEGKIRTLLWCLPLTIISMNLVAAEADDAGRLQELVYGEALFHSQQQDYLSAISRLQLGETQGLLPPSSEAARLLLARMKLAYGMHLEAGFELHALLGEGVPAPARNRAWYELARAFSHKGYSQAAAEALDNIHGELPVAIIGDHQLLRATVLMSLNQNREAAQGLAQWRGAPELAAYAHYNRGIALVRAGDYPQVVPALQLAVQMPARGEELLALRDKARLALGYAFAREEDYKKARKQLETVRPQGPFANRALLALGWIAYKQGQSEAALISWTELRGRSPTDPAVLETLLVVPAVHRELDAMQTATRDYEAAVATYRNELYSLIEARESVATGRGVSLLLQRNSGPGQDTGSQHDREAIRFFGPLLASRDFTQMLQGHSELYAMLNKVDQGLREIDSLPESGDPVNPRVVSAQAPLSPTPAAPEPAQLQQQQPPPQPNKTKTGDQQWQQEWIQRQGETTDHPAPTIPQLPEIESPAARVLKPFPERHSPSRPQVSNFFREPPNSEIIGMPDSKILWLPESGEFFRRPESGEFLRRPGEQEEDDYAYPDATPQGRVTPGEQYAYQLNRLLPAGEEKAGFNPGAIPVGEALRNLAAALNNTNLRMTELGASDSAAEIAGLEARIAALRARILALRARIANAIALYESYTRALALDELDRRQLLLEDLLEQASLELAKTYDQSSDR
jgi:tetratricopeptide (TPR) repeat protein